MEYTTICTENNQPYYLKLTRDLETDLKEARLDSRFHHKRQIYGSLYGLYFTCTEKEKKDYWQDLRDHINEPIQREIYSMDVSKELKEDERESDTEKEDHEIEIDIDQINDDFVYNEILREIN